MFRQVLRERVLPALAQWVVGMNPPTRQICFDVGGDSPSGLCGTGAELYRTGAGALQLFSRDWRGVTCRSCLRQRVPGR